MGKAKKITVGYKYFMNVHMGLGRGPLNSINEIRVGDRVAWEGNATNSGKIYINQPELFGGDNGEGGIVGDIDVYMGGSTQTIGLASKLAGLLKGVVPGFRGITTALYSGQISSMNPYPKPWAFRVRRTTNGWDGPCWYQEKATIIVKGYLEDGTTRDIHAMNPAHIIYEAITNREWGRGLDKALVMEAEFVKCADALYDEGFGLCIRWGRQDLLESFIQVVLDHINGALYVDKFTGLLKLKLIRDDYSFDSLPVFDSNSGLLSIQDAQNSSPASLINEVIVEWHNPVTNQEAQVRQHNLAAIQSQGSVNSMTASYIGVPTAKQALQLAQRDLRVASTNLRKFTLECDRRAWHIQPGDLIRIKDPDSRGLADIAVRIGTTAEQDQSNGKITLVGVQDTFTFNLNTFSKIENPSFEKPDLKPAIARRKVYEMTYAELSQRMPPGEFNAIKNFSGYINAHAEKPTPVSMGFELNVKPEGQAYFKKNGNGSFTAVAALSGNIGYLDNVIYFNNAVELLDLTEGQYAVIENEIVRVDLIVYDSENNTGELRISRGIMDTIPQLHYTNELIWFVEDGGGTDWAIYSGGEHVDMKIVPYTLSGGKFDIEQTPVDSIDFNFRFFRPYAPGLVKTSTQYSGDLHWFEKQTLRADVGVSETPDNLTVTWAHRDRVLQADKYIDHLEGSIGPEIGATYTVKVLNEKGDVVRTQSGITGTQWFYSYGNAATDMKIEQSIVEPLTGTIKLYTVRDNIESWMEYSISFDIYKKPPQEGMIASFAEISAQQSDYNGDLGGISVASIAEQAAQSSPMTDISGINLSIMAQPATQLTKLIPNVSFNLIEFPYITLLRDGRVSDRSQVMGMMPRPSDRITDGFDMFDSYDKNGPWTDNGSQPWTPWGMITTNIGHLDNEFEIGDSSDTDGVPTSNVQSGDLLLLNNELMVIKSVNGKRYTVGRGSADTIPSKQAAYSIAWLFDRGHAAANTLFQNNQTAFVKMRPHTYALEISLNDLKEKSIAMQYRPIRPYPPGLMLANGVHWFEKIKGIKDDFDIYNPRGGGIPVTFTWAHRNRLSQGDVAKDHFDVGILPEPGVQYRIWVGYTYRDSNDVYQTVTLFEGYTEDSGWTYSAEMAERHGYEAGVRNNSAGYTVVTVNINAVRNGVANWQGYSMSITVPSYPAKPGEKPGGETGGGETGGGGDGGGVKPPNPGDGGPTDPVIPPVDPVIPVDPEVPPTEPEPPEPEPPIPPEDIIVPGWGNDWDHGWGEGITPDEK